MSCQLSVVGHPSPVVREEALRVLGVLRSMTATAPQQAMTDREIATRAGVAVRDVIDLAAELAEIGVAVLASCGRDKGRYISNDPDSIRRYGQRLHKRAIRIHGRAAVYLRLADRLDARRPVETNGQARLFQVKVEN